MFKEPRKWSVRLRVGERKSGIMGEKGEGPDRVELGKPAKEAWVLVNVKRDSTEML